jgi:DNA-binding MarR family transcriptional regulator
VSTALEKLIQESRLDPASCVLRHVTRTSRLLVTAFDAALSEAGLTSHQFNLLMVLARAGSMNVNSLAAAVGMHPSTTPRLIARLVEDGLIRVKSGPDRRERLIAITRKGDERLRRAYPCWAVVQREILHQLGDNVWLTTIKKLKDIRTALRTAQGS